MVAVDGIEPLTRGFSVRGSVTRESFGYGRLEGSHPVLSPLALAEPH
jgi:hypothetical protein